MNGQDLTEARRTSCRRDISIEAIAERDGWSCLYCRVPLTRAGRPGSVYHDDDDGVYYTLEEGFAFAERDHVLPTSRGGSDAPENIVLACSGCNSRKGARTPGEWLGSKPEEVFA